MSKIEEYQALAAGSLVAAEEATNERDRAHHRRAYSIYRKLVANVGEAEVRAQARAPAKIAPLKPAAPKVR